MAYTHQRKLKQLKFNPILSLFPSSEILMKQHGKPKGNSINGHSAWKFLHMWKFYKSVLKARSWRLATLVQHLIVGPQTLKFHKLDLYSHRQHFYRIKKTELTCLLGHSDQQIVEWMGRFWSAAHKSLTWHQDRRWESLDLTRTTWKVIWCSSLWNSPFYLFIEAFQCSTRLLVPQLRPWGFWATFSGYFFPCWLRKSADSP